MTINSHHTIAATTKSLILLILLMFSLFGCQDDTELKQGRMKTRSTEEPSKNMDNKNDDSVVEAGNVSIAASADDGEQSEDNPASVVAGSGAGTDSVVWSIPCQGSDTITTPPKSTAGKLKIQVKGTLCPQQQTPRDILFVIDISGSMDPKVGSVKVVVDGKVTTTDLSFIGADPMLNNGCGRLDALTTVLDEGSPESRYGLITFDGIATKETAGFVDETTFRTTVLTKEIVCQARGGTNYEQALTTALEVLDQPRENDRLILFLSDGEPDVDNEGFEIAAKVREKATIATVMLQPTSLEGVKPDGSGSGMFRKFNNGETLKNFIASRNNEDIPFHSASIGKDELIEQFLTYTDTSFAGLTFSYRTEKSGAWVDHDMMPSIDAAEATYGVDLDPVPLSTPHYFEGKVIMKQPSGIESKRQKTLSW